MHQYQRSLCRVVLAIVLLCLMLPLSVLGAEQFTGKVVGISDGDTISVLREGKAVKVRLHGIDTPESKQAFGTRAKQYGRSLNQELVRAGMAWWYRQFAPKDTVLQQLEADAKAAKRGLWGDPHAVAPWEFRKQRQTR